MRAAVLALLLLVLPTGGTSFATAAVSAGRSCDAVVADINAARGVHDMDKLGALWPEAGASNCAEQTLYCVGQAIALTVVEATYARAEDGATPDQLRDMLVAGRAYSTPWQLEAAIGDVTLAIAKGTNAGRDFSDAAFAYQQALIRLSGAPACGDAEAAARPAPADIAILYRHMSAALLLADPLRVATTRCAPCQWLFLSSVAGFSPAVRPLPITFAQGSSRPTPEGKAAIAALLQCLKAGGYRHIALTGHADPVGPAPSNLRLSSRRLETIKRLLLEGGFTGDVVTNGHGEADPFPSADEGFTEAQTLRLDRRIELTEADAPAGTESCE